MFDEGAARQARPEETKHYTTTECGERPTVKAVISKVVDALEAKGYRPVDQLVGFLVTGDPAYITSHGEARLWIKKLDRDEILSEILRDYLSRAGETEGR